MTQLDAVLVAACLALTVMWLGAGVHSQRVERAAAERDAKAVAALEEARTAIEGAAAALTATQAERDAAVARAETAEQHLNDRARLRERLALLTDDEVKEQLLSRCMYCGGVHERACQRVRSLRFRPDGRSPLAVEFWEHWDSSDVIWPEDYVAGAADRRAVPQEQPELRVITG